MKRITKILSISLVLIMLSVNISFAAGSLELEDVYPADGSTGHEILNMMVRLDFNGDVATEELKEANEKCYSLIGPDGEEKSLRFVYNGEDKVNLLVEEEMVEDAEYTVKIDGSIISADGSTLGEDKEIKFYTKDPSKEMIGTSIMMGIMMVVVIGATLRSQKKQSQKEAPAKPEKINPYKKDKK